MAQTIQLSDALYQAIDEYRNDDQSLQDVVEEMAIETGILGDVSSLSELYPSLQSLYGYNEEEINELLTVLRIIYTAEAEAPYNKINYPDYNYDSWTLYDLDLRQSTDSQRLTPIGRDVASEAVENYLKSNSAEIRDVLDSYDDKVLWFFISYGLNKLDSGHLTTHDSTLNSGQTAPWQTKRIEDTYQNFIGDIRELEIAVSVSSTVSYGNIKIFTVLPPEFESFTLGNVSVDEESLMKKIEVYKTLTDYVERRIETQEEILDQLHNAEKSDFVQEVERLEAEDLTSKYIEDQPVSPVMIQDIKKTLAQIRQYTESELGLAE